MSALHFDPHEATYLGGERLLLYQPATAEYTVHHLNRYGQPPCAPLAGGPAFAGSVGARWQKFVHLGAGDLMQFDPRDGATLPFSKVRRESERLTKRLTMPLTRRSERTADGRGRRQPWLISLAACESAVSPGARPRASPPLDHTATDERPCSSNVVGSSNVVARHGR